MKPAILTGQQIGLLGGPLYTAYKVLGAVHLAHRLDGQATYWLETNDADFNEINHFHYLDKDNRLKTLVWDIPSHGLSCGYIEVDDKLVSLLETFFHDLRQTEFTPQLREMALNCYRSGRTLAQASKDLAAQLFGDLELNLFTPFDQSFRDFSRPILKAEAQRTPDGQQCNLFCLVDKQRKAVFKKENPKGENQYVLRDGAVADLDKYPLLPNVKTRNLCQDAFFNAHTYVAGPGEIKYIAELDPIYQFHGVKKAAVMPRMSITLLEPTVKRLLQKRDLSLAEVLETTKEALLKKVMQKSSGFDFQAARRDADGYTREYLNQLQSVGLEKAELKNLRNLLQGEIKKSLGTFRAREKEKNLRLLNDAASLSDRLAPFDKKQERVFNLFYYMNLYGGKTFVKRLYDFYNPEATVMEI